jgi:hypothetical protein
MQAELSAVKKYSEMYDFQHVFVKTILSQTSLRTPSRGWIIQPFVHFHSVADQVDERTMHPKLTPSDDPLKKLHLQHTQFREIPLCGIAHCLCRLCHGFSSLSLLLPFCRMKEK